MKTLIVSDIHSNLTALEAVFKAAEEDGPLDQVWCLGDIVGYGPHPSECIARLREAGTMAITGNHDAAACGRIGLGQFNYYAADACRWTMTRLSEDDLAYLRMLPETLAEEPFLLVHGSPRDPMWDYVLGYQQALEVWDRTDAHAVLLGHSHFQFYCEAGRGMQQPGPQGMFIPISHTRLVINPGSTGQPRDRDPRAAYAIYDDDARSITLKRAWYDVASTQRAMADAGLPEPLITRLSTAT